MDKVLIFAGTTEGRRLAEFLEKNQAQAHVCVATEYGEQLLPQGKYIHVHAGRLMQREMQELMEQEQITLVVDATHPYAAVVSENIRNACKSAEEKPVYIRLERKASKALEEEQMVSDVVLVNSVPEAAGFLAGQKGNILAATGSKELAAYTVIPDYEKRVFARVLSTAEAAAQCAALGFAGKNLICMQGPFSEDLNAAMLEQVHAEWMVTKEAGKEGGFDEKLRAAKRAGAKLVLVKRPDTGELPENTFVEGGFICRKGDEMEVRRMLCECLHIRPVQRISLIGIGMGNAGNMTLEAKQACDQAQLLIGAERMLACADTDGKAVFQSYKAGEIAEYIKTHPQYEEIAVLLSGDIGFYSGAKGLYEALGQVNSDGKMEIVPYSGISSVVYFCGKLGIPWEDVRLVSMHGRRRNLIAEVKHNRKVFVLCGEKGGVNALCRKLLEYGMGQVKISAGTDLSYENEQIVTGTAEDFVKREFAVLSVLLIENEESDAVTVHGIEDECFLREKIPMTKSEVRSISLSKMRLTRDAVAWDVGAGTGSVSVEMALQAYKGKVYAVEKKPEAVRLIGENKKKFAADNLTVVEGAAPEALSALPAPTHVFIGGSSGNLREIMALSLEKNPKVRIVINAIALETVSDAMECLKTLPVTDTDVVSAAIGKAKSVGPYHMMMGQNPVYIISCTGAGGEKA